MRIMMALIGRNLLNFSRDKMRFFMTLFMSVFFLFVFSFVMKSQTAGIEHPMNYLISGIIIMMVFQASLSHSMNTLEDISSGFMKEILVSPVSRWQISVGQIFSSAILATLQGLIVIVLGLFMGLRMSPLSLLGMLLVMILTGLTFSSFGLFMATLARNSSTFQMLVSVVSMPLTFLSGAYIPTTVMPKIIQPLVYVNPLTYTTSIFRYITLEMQKLSTAELIKAGVAFDLGGVTITPFMGLLIIAAMGMALFLLCVKQFNKADFSKVQVFRH